MSGASEESSSESGGVMDWALVDSHGDLEVSSEYHYSSVVTLGVLPKQK